MVPRIIFSLAVFKSLSGATISLSRNPFYPDVMTPRVTVRLEHNSDKNLGFSLAFHTVSDKSFMHIDDPHSTGHSRPGSMYSGSGVDLLDPPVDAGPFVASAVAHEMATLLSEDTGSVFQFEVDIHLSSQVGSDPSMNPGFLAAQYGSDFARAASKFTYVGGRDGGELLIGHSVGDVESAYCNEGQSLSFLPISLQVWMVNGATSFGDYEISCRFVIDTATNHIVVPGTILERVKAKLVGVGAKIYEEIPGFAPVFSNCDRIGQLPSIVITLGSVEVSVTPSEYLIMQGGDEGLCSLVLVAQAESGYFRIGMPFLNKLVTMFDRDQSQVGFCNYRHYQLETAETKEEMIISLHLPEEHRVSLHLDGGHIVPRIYVQFGRNRNEDRTFSLLFDTGADASFIGSGYQDELRLGQRTNRCTIFGSEDNPGSISTSGFVTELVILQFPSPIELELVFHLMCPSFGDPAFAYSVGSGIFGARFDSQFAKITGRFAYVGGNAGGELVVGGQLDGLCAEDADVAFSPNMGSSFWKLEGSISASDGSGPTIRTNLIIDTGYSNTAIPKEIFDAIMGKIEISRHLSCDELRVTLPDIQVRFSSGFIVSLTPAEYIVGNPTCTVMLVSGDRHRSGDQIIGMPFLKKLVTIFDRADERIGFCHKPVVAQIGHNSQTRKTKETNESEDDEGDHSGASIESIQSVSDSAQETHHEKGTRVSEEDLDGKNEETKESGDDEGDHSGASMDSIQLVSATMVSEEELDAEIQGLRNDLTDAGIIPIDARVTYPSRAAGMSLEDRIRNFSAIKRIRAHIQEKITAAITVQVSGEISADEVEAEIRAIRDDCEDLQIADIEFQASMPRSALGMDSVRRRRVIGALLTKKAELHAKLAQASSSLSIPHEVSEDALREEIEGLEGDCSDLDISGLPYRATIPGFRADMDADQRRRLFTAIRIKRPQLQSLLENEGSSLSIDPEVSPEKLQEEIDGLQSDIREADAAGTRLGPAYWPSSISGMDADRRRRVFIALKIMRRQLRAGIEGGH